MDALGKYTVAWSQGGSGGALPGLELWDARPYFDGSTERAVIHGVPAGD